MESNVDYTNPVNWMVRSEDPVHDVDLIFIVGSTIWDSTMDNGVADISERMKKSAVRLYYDIVAGLADMVNIYAPYYRQLSLRYAANLNANVAESKRSEVYLRDVQSKEPKTDIFSALDYYFTTHNNGRPFILAGHSQGSVIIFSILEEYMKIHPDYYRRMIAAYAVGYGVSRRWLSANPHIRFSQSRDDTGVLLSWNTEGPNPEGTNILLMPDTLVTNPITWRTDEIPAPASENLGSLIQLEDGTFKRNSDGSLAIESGLHDAVVNRKRGSVMCTTSFAYLRSVFFGTQSLHTSDYILYYGNFRENIRQRIIAYLGQDESL
ncbi:MAG TPA: DUF3089 domain-containing protein [Methanocorpusculum sp.]|nr:DUF3089 domain-containing protein [Methanocorpusculum sp.]